MRLTDLGAKFVQWTPTGYTELDSSARGANGIFFLCPTPGHAHGILLWFNNPLDCPLAPPEAPPRSRWPRMGETLDTLSLAPSINVSHDWHGYVIDGRIQ